MLELLEISLMSLMYLAIMLPKCVLFSFAGRRLVEASANERATGILYRLRQCELLMGPQFGCMYVSRFDEITINFCPRTSLQLL